MLSIRVSATGLFVVLGTSLGLLGVILPQATFAQISVTPGATEAHACYITAGDGLSQNTDECDAALLKQSLLTRRDIANTYVNRGIILNRTGDFGAAIADFDAALAIKNTLAEAFLNRGNSFFMMGQVDKALADYEASLSNGIEKAYAAWYNIGLVYDVKNMPQEARSAYEKSLAARPGYQLAEEKFAR